MVFSSPLDFQLIAEIGGTSILPNNGIADRLSSFSIPHDHRFSLVGNSNRGNVACSKIGICESFLHRRFLSRPDLFRVVLNPARLREYLSELLLSHTFDASIVIKNNGAAASGALVDRQNVFCHLDTPCLS